MWKNIWLIGFLLLVIGLQFPVMGNCNPMPVNITHDYRIYFFSEEGADLDSIYGSYLNIRYTKDVGITYDYYIKADQHVQGSVEQYSVIGGEQRYTLRRFFSEQSDAVLRILDMPTCDNMKVAVIQYANEKEDSLGIFLQYILIEDEKLPANNTKYNY